MSVSAAAGRDGCVFVDKMATKWFIAIMKKGKRGGRGFDSGDESL